MTEFIVELYVPRNDCDAVAAAAKRLRAAAAELTAEGRGVQLVRSIFVPADETCFLLVEGDTADDVRETARRAGVLVDSVAETSSEHALEVPERREEKQ
jgi:histidinol-phosphate/aromatic aminotransferase/cobyric acid decarboxylase-like protein